MKKNLLLTIMTLATVVLAVVATRQHRELVRLRKAVVRQPAGAAPAHQRAVPAKSKPLPPPEEDARLTAPPAIAPPLARAAETQPAGGMFSQFSRLAKDPAFKDMMRAQQKMVLGIVYGDLFKKLGLGATELEALKELLVERNLAQMDVSMSVLGTDAMPADRRQKLKEALEIREDYDRKIQDLLGPEAFAMFKDFEETQSERMQVNLFKQSLGASDALTEQQETDLIAAMYAERKAMPEMEQIKQASLDPANLTEDGMAEMMKILSGLHERYLQRAGLILNSSQLEQFKKSLEQQRTMQMMSLKMAAQMLGQHKPAAPR